MSHREALNELAEAATDFREKVIRQMYADGFPEKESARLCELLVENLKRQKGERRSI